MNPEVDAEGISAWCFQLITLLIVGSLWRKIQGTHSHNWPSPPLYYTNLHLHPCSEIILPGFLWNTSPEGKLKRTKLVKWIIASIAAIGLRQQLTFVLSIIYYPLKSTLILSYYLCRSWWSTSLYDLSLHSWEVWALEQIILSQAGDGCTCSLQLQLDRGVTGGELECKVEGTFQK